MRYLVANRNLGLLVIGQLISAIGDHFYLIGLPWLALQVTGNAFTAGTLLAAASLPRAVFMLVGGAATDRFSARWVLITSNGAQAVLMTVLAAAVLAGYVQLGLLHGLAFLTGLVDAFGLPALNTVLPGAAGEIPLEDANVYLQGANMASGVIGPALAGFVIGGSESGGVSAGGLEGIGYAFLLNALTFLVGIAFFWGIRVRGGDQDRASQAPLVSSIRGSVAYILEDKKLRALFALMLLLGLFLTGTIRVGFPMLADSRPGGGAQDFGNMSAAFGGGLLLGMVALRILPRPTASISGLLALVLISPVSAGLILLGLGIPLLASLGVILLMGIGVGYVVILLLSWLQRRTPSHLLGRMMALVLFATIGLSPLSQLLMGYLLDLNLRATLVGVGGLLLLFLLLTGSSREMWALED